ncbi:glycosyltransferase family 4 protein [Winogradskyella immobilis]|uniref:Glycosyltransferase family 4 protein n=1 Tax=Winogradskyella immobilis TaxID=2816852 RepID=A0ABS8EKE4_9FLAO|nr:glycosyltransferase family 4 protein [Winogradskyella immobilis]MCC1483486.1 glycosyltransferase family 4 protein [Winogradskyella immobilis]MCG0015580.1 glycosyltransferase family 4 protein [Winogradskyella immobilis]
MIRKKTDKALVFLLNHMNYGGCQKIVFDLLSGVYESFDVVYLIAEKGYYSDLLIKTTSIQFIDRTNISIFGVVKEIQKIQTKCPSLILHTHNRIDILFKYTLRKSDNHLHTFHSAYLNKNYLYKFIKPEKAISISKTVKDYLNKYNIDNEMIYNGISINNSKPYCKTKELDIPKILYIGRLSKEKGFDNILKALLTYKSNQFNHIQFDVIGEGKNVEEYNKMIVNSGGNLKMNLKGYRPNPWDNINEYDLLIIPSYFEGFCLVAVEGASIGIPILSNDILALREVLDFSQDSNFFNIQDLNSIHTTIFKSLTEISIQRELALNNAERIKNKFSKEKMLLNYLRIYETFS